MLVFVFFLDDESSDLGIVYDDKAIENLLDRSLVTTDDKGPVDENLLANQYLGQFKVNKITGEPPYTARTPWDQTCCPLYI